MNLINKVSVELNEFLEVIGINRRIDFTKNTVGEMRDG